MSDDAPPRPAVLLDVDGTLVDSNLQHVLAWQRALHGLGRDVGSAVLLAHTGIGGDQFVAAVTDDDFERDHGDAARDAHSREWAQLEGGVIALPGAADALGRLLDAGVRVVIASSAEPQELDGHLDRLGIDADRLAGTVTSGDVEASKPEPDVFGVALEQAGVEARDAVAIGDTRWDGESARAAGVAFVGVTSGGIAAEVLRAAGAVAVCDDLRDVVDRFEEITAALQARGPH